MSITDFLPGYSSTLVSSTLSFVNVGIGTPIASCSFLITSVKILIESEVMSNYKIRINNLGDWINVFNLRKGKTLKQSVIDRTLEQKEADEEKVIPNPHLIKRSDFLKKNSY